MTEYNNNTDPDAATRNTAVNARILQDMRETISPMPSTPKFRRKSENKPPIAPNLFQTDASSKETATRTDQQQPESSLTTTTTATPTVPSYPIQQATKVPSFKRTAALLRKYPSLTLVKQLSSKRNLVAELDDHDNFMEEQIDNAALLKQAEIVQPPPPPPPDRDDSAAAVGVNIVSVQSDDEDSDVSESSQWDEMNLEVLPGVAKRLKGSAETYEAFRRGECIETACLACSVLLLCMSECEGVICPLCLSMSPVDTLKGVGNGTVGLGIQFE